MASFRIEFTRSATKDLRAVDRQWVARIMVAIERLADDAIPIGCKKLVGSEHSFRIRVGDYRVIYDLQNESLVISVIRIRHRREVYR
jgi:mRNA interferase RelE/StbE